MLKKKLNFSDLTEKSPKLLQIAGKVAENYSHFWQQNIATSGHSEDLLSICMLYAASSDQIRFIHVKTWLT